jgi:hypothetical protein
MSNTVPSGDLVAQGSMPISDNDYPIQGFGLSISNSKTLTGNNTAGIAVPIFTVTGSVQVLALYGVITTTLGANNTAAYWRLNDGTAQSNITVNTGTTLSAAAAGSIIVKKDLASAALALLSNTQERVSEPTTLETLYFSPFVAVAKAATTTNIEFLYSTTDTPTSGVIVFYAQYLPLGQGSKLQTL